MIFTSQELYTELKQGSDVLAAVKQWLVLPSMFRVVQNAMAAESILR